MSITTIELNAMKRSLGYINRADCCRNCVHFAKTTQSGVPNCNLMRYPAQPQAICKKHERRKEE